MNIKEAFEHVWILGIGSGFDLPDAAKESVYVVSKEVINLLNNPNKHEVIYVKAEALLVKVWRTSGKTLRQISSLIVEYFPEKGCQGDNQLEGKCICDEAAEILGEDHWEWRTNENNTRP